MTKLDMNIQLAAGELITISRTSQALTPDVYQVVYERYGIREEQLGLLFSLIDLEFMRRVPGLDDSLFEGRSKKL